MGDYTQSLQPEDLEWLRGLIDGDHTDILLSHGRAHRILNSVEQLQAEVERWKGLTVEAESRMHKAETLNIQQHNELRNLRERVEGLPRYDCLSDLDDDWECEEKDGLYVKYDELRAALKGGE